jgi:hypothetical protein
MRTPTVGAKASSSRGKALDLTAKVIASAGNM